MQPRAASRQTFQHELTLGGLEIPFELEGGHLNKMSILNQFRHRSDIKP